jgi:hypothetical protein
MGQATKAGTAALLPQPLKALETNVVLDMISPQEKLFCASCKTLMLHF